MSSPAEQERLETLIADEVVFGLAPGERGELEQLTHQVGVADPAAPFETAAAAYYLAGAAIETESLPPALRSSVLDNWNLPADETASPGLEQVSKATEPTAGGVQKSSRSSSVGPSPSRWFLAIAASLLLGYLLGQPWQAPGAIPKTPAAELAALAGSEPQLTRVAWAATEDPAAAGASGEVVWSDAQQRGFMVFRGLAANDPAKEQYQLWIFDAERDDRYPVDGGVFDIVAGEEETVTPIDAKIAVAKAVMFAITVEPPGGVVVSDRSRLPLLAKVD